VKRATGKAPDFISVDLSDQAAIRVFAAQFNETHPRLDVLINNAGGMFGRRQLSADGIEMTFAPPILASSSTSKISKASGDTLVGGHIVF